MGKCWLLKKTSLVYEELKHHLPVLAAQSFIEFT